MGFLDAFFPPTPEVLDKAKQEIENARASGSVFPADKMDAVHQIALHNILRNTPRPTDTPNSPLDEEVTRRAKILGATK